MEPTTQDTGDYVDVRDERVALVAAGARPLRPASRSRPTPWYRLTGALNRLVWRAPLPRRVALRVSRSVYRSPPTSVAQVERVLGALSSAGVAVRVVGGWGVDALVGRATRVHRDIDLYLAFQDEEVAARVLARLGYSEHYRFTSEVPTHSRTVFSDPIGRVVDLHPVSFGAVRETFSEGMIGTSTVSCLSCASQLQAHSGYRLRRHHRHDMAVLRPLL